MQIIKKYANRKLYHTNRKRYITLEGIANLIQAGEPVQVIDNETSDDITAPILAQVAAQPRNGLWPSTGALADLIRTSGDTLAGMGRSLFAGIRGTSLVDAEIDRRLDILHTQGHLTAEEADRLRRLLHQAGASDLTESGDLASHADLPSRDDLDKLRAQVDVLTTMVEQLLTQQK